MEVRKCNVCKLRANIKCDQCPEPIYFCSRGHLYTHKMKYHRALSASRPTYSKKFRSMNNTTNMSNINNYLTNKSKEDTAAKIMRAKRKNQYNNMDNSDKFEMIENSNLSGIQNTSQLNNKSYYSKVKKYCNYFHFHY